MATLTMVDATHIKRSRDNKIVFEILCEHYELWSSLYWWQGRSKKNIAFKEKVSEIICQLEENAPKNYSIPFSYANDVDVGVILTICILIQS